MLGIVEAVVGYAVFVFHDRQYAQRLGQHGQFLGMNRYLAHLGAEHKTLDTDEVADVEQLFKDYIVHLLLHGLGFLALGHRSLDIVATDIDLDAAFRVL